MMNLEIIMEYRNFNITIDIFTMLNHTNISDAITINSEDLFS